MISFQEMGLSEEILKAIKELNFIEPTPIQQEAIPQLLSNGSDLIATAQTGTGKTAAFGIPSLQLTRVNEKLPQTFILCPTRELCLQITKDLKTYSKHLPKLNIVPVYGGSSIEVQIKLLAKGSHIVVATPGRATDLLRRKKLKLSQIERVILDEADEMLSMGFKDDLETLLEATPPERQTLLFSATMNKEIKSITKKYMQDAVEIAVAKMNSASDQVQHHYYMVRANDRYAAVKRIVDLNPRIYAIIFCRTRRETKEVSKKLMHDGYNAEALHGDLSQAQRETVMEKFRMKQLQLLVATDVAARGLDVNDLTHVINFNLPDEIASYTHRSGRTGRAGKKGTSIAIIHSKELGKIKRIEKNASLTFEKKLVPTGKDICEKQLYALIDKIERVEVDEQQISAFLPYIDKKLQWLSREQLIKQVVSIEFNRFLSYYKNDRDINIQHNEKRSKERKGDSHKSRKQYNFERIFVNIGSKNNLRPARLIALINEALGFGNAEIGKIEILKKFSFFEIEDKLAIPVLSGLHGKTVGGVHLKPEIAREEPQTPSQKRDARRSALPKGRKKSGKSKKRRY